MTTIVGSRRDADGNATAYYDTNSQETLVRMSPVTLDEDFIGAGHSSIPVAGTPATGYPWVRRTVQTAGAPSVAIVANSVGGQVLLALDATSEKQEASLYANDVLNWDVTKGLVWEARIALAVLPGAGVEAVWGLQSTWIDGPDNAGFYARFQALASGAVSMQTKDGVNTLSAATGFTLAAGGFHIFRIDATNPGSVVFSIDGTNVSAPNQMSFLATGASAVLQPYVSVYKAAGVATGSMLLDMVQLAMNRS